MKRTTTIALTVALTLIAGVAIGAQREKTADRYVREQGITCVYSKPRIEADTDGRTIIITGKRCEATSR